MRTTSSAASRGRLCLKTKTIPICTVVVVVVALVCLVSIINCQNEEFSTNTNDCTHKRHQPQVRQQRKYVPIGQAAKLQQQEEFSLISSALAQGAANPKPANSLPADTNYSLAPADPQAEPASGATTPTMVGLDSIGPSVVLQPPVTTTSSIMSPNKSPQSPTTSSAAEPNSSPSPPTSTSAASTTTATSTTTTTTSSPSTDLPPAKQHREEPTSQGHTSKQQVGRRTEDGEATQRSLSLDHQQSQPISSSPSSVSIITPLNNPAASQQQQQQQHTAHVSASIGGGQLQQQSSSAESQQSMMRPIYVVGNPITERDYYSPTASNTNNRYPPELGEQPVATVSAASPVSSEPPQTQEPAATPQTDQAKPNNMEQPASRQQQPASKSSRMDDSTNQQQQSAQVDVTLQSQQDPPTGERMSGPPLVYSGGFLGSALSSNQTQAAVASPRLFQQNSTILSSQVGSGASVIPQLPRRPSLPPPVNQANAASGFRSPLSPSGPLLGNGNTQVSGQQQQPLAPISSVPVNSMSNFYQSSPPYAGNGAMPSLMGNSFPTAPQQQQPQPLAQPPMLAYNKQAYAMANQAREQHQQQQQQQQTAAAQQAIQQQQQVIPSPMPGTAPGSGRRPLNITRVEHISAECSNDLIRAVIVFNGTFKGIIYSSGYVNDPTCLYVNGTGSTRYEFNIRLNQCGTLGRQELHQPTIPGEARRRDQVMWNTLSIQYNSIIEQEWDEHFRVSCEYGSDFWKTVSFNPFNVETNTGSPVVFTINPPQCQMDVLLGHGMGPKIAVDGPVTVGDPLTLLIHMKSEKAGYDILVKNCVAHNGGKQRMQLIDSNGCVVNERFISPFRGTYNDNDLRHVTLYAYLKAFRFTGSPVLYLECEIHMCQSACPPQMCYWRRLSKRSVDESDYEYVASNSSSNHGADPVEKPVISDSLSLFKALQVRQEPDEERSTQRRTSVSARQSKRVRDIFAEDEQASLVCYRHAEVYLFLMTIGSLLLLLISVAVTCCLRLRNLAKSNLFKHGRLLSGSPSLLSLGSGAGNDATSIMSTSTSHVHSPVVAASEFQDHLGFIKPPANINKRPPGNWPNMAHVDLAAARKQRQLSNPQQQYLASFAQFSPKPVHR